MGHPHDYTCVSTHMGHHMITHVSGVTCATHMFTKCQHSHGPDNMGYTSTSNVPDLAALPAEFGLVTAAEAGREVEHSPEAESALPAVLPADSACEGSADKAGDLAREL